jgi:peptidoglycan/LPS O-acetylase OafA/YrhL
MGLTLQEASSTEQRLLASGDEAGTAPGDRRFRPDVEGLRAVAVLLVVFYHAGVPHLTGGYVGVDVFFVISGFVITGLLLREHAGTGHTSILDFYARRCRRILPAATLVLLVTAVTAYVVLGVVTGNNTADDARWAAVFLSNFHFEALGTNYLSAFRPPSPVQNYWSLSVEEQFYVVYPTLFLLAAKVKSTVSVRARMAVVLSLVIVGSYWLSIVQTASHPAAAYFSPVTRAWELALGALVAVGTSWLKEIPRPAAAVLTWAGLAAVIFAAVDFNAQTAYPGSLVAVPVVGAALIIAGGTSIPRAGVEQLLGLPPVKWLGKHSYSLYLWHWPILIIAAEQVGKTTLSVGENLLLVLVALGLSVVTYRLVENPVRHWRLPSPASVLMGLGLVLATIVILSLLIIGETTPYPDYTVAPAPNQQVVLDRVAAAAHIIKVPASIEPPVSQASNDWGGRHEAFGCQAGLTQYRENICTLGDPSGKDLLVVYGDSHALMWLQAFDAIAEAAHWRLIVLGKSDCPALDVTVRNPPGIGTTDGLYVACDMWHQWAVGEINRLHPTLVVVTEETDPGTPATAHSPSEPFTSAAWRDGLTKLFAQIDGPRTRTVLLGNIPLLAQSGPVCLAAHPGDVQACSTPVGSTGLPLNAVERSTAAASGVQYIDPTPWFCARTCTAVIGNYGVYLDQFHITSTYAQYLSVVLGRALGIPLPGR